MLSRLALSVILGISVVPAALAAPAKAPGGGTTRPAAQKNAPNPGLVKAQDAYLQRLRAKLANNWLLPDGNNHVEISATVNSDGSIDNPVVVSTPKDAAAETAASDAFSKSQPLEGLPSGITSAKVQLSFQSKVDPHGDSSSNINTNMTPIEANKPASGATAGAGTDGAAPQGK